MLSAWIEAYGSCWKFSVIDGQLIIMFITKFSSPIFRTLLKKNVQYISTDKMHEFNSVQKGVSTSVQMIHNQAQTFRYDTHFAGPVMKRISESTSGNMFNQELLYRISHCSIKIQLLFRSQTRMSIKNKLSQWQQ